MPMSFSLNRRTLFGAVGGGLLSAPFLMSRAAVADTNPGAGMKKTQLPDIHQFKVGTFNVVVVKDGARPMEKPNEIFGTNQTPEAVGELLAQNFLPADRFVNSFSPTLIDTGSDVVLFDTGLGAAAREQGGGRLLDGLAAAGYSPEQVSIVVLTHMHGDHIGGLMENGAPAFKNARYVAGQVEYDFWSDKAREGSPAEGGHKAVLANVVPLAEKTTFIGDNATVVPGITSMLAAGHSPGHMIFRVESGDKQLILTADTANHFVLSLQRPDWEVRYDMDKAAAAATRKKVFDMIATDRLGFLGYHMPFPAVGFVEKVDAGYRFVPKSYQFDI
ncbi:MAG: MBL fold metallo-hydrolase [Rhizobium sp. 63-7]|nr:MAG: MBL fold metallo-hydrolase [Rhizobium sp. 63-7]